MDAKLILLTDPSHPIYAIDSEEVTIGRDATCRIRLQNMMVSQRHCRILQEGERLLIEDVGSTHGTAVNQRALKHREPTELSHGDHVWLGPEHLRLAIGSGALPEDSPADWINPLSSEGKRVVQARAASSVWERFLGRFRPKEGASSIVEEGARSLIKVTVEDPGAVGVVTVLPAVVALDGDVALLFEEVDRLVASGRKRLLFNLGNVTQLSKKVLAELLRVARTCATEGGSVKICRVQDDVAAFFRQTALDQEIEVYRDVKAALTSPWPDPALAAGRAAPFTERSVDSSATVAGLPLRRVRLAVAVGRAKGQIVELGSAQYLIGRDTRCHLRPNDDTVSRLHAMIEQRGNRVWIRDLRSGCGTIVNGRTLRGEEAEIFTGDTLQIGFLRFTCTIDDLVPAGRADDEPTLPREMVVGRAVSGTSPTLRVARPEPPRSLSEAAPADAKKRKPLTSEVIDGTLVVTLLSPNLNDEASISPVRFELQLLQDQPLPRRMIIRFDNVSFLSRGAVVMLLARNQELERAGGGMRLCNASPSVGSFLEQTQLPMLIEVFPTFEEALAAPWK